MPQHRKYKTNADRQAAYRARKAALTTPGDMRDGRGQNPIVRRVMAADRAESATR
jgi:hypothetical protein